MFTISNDRDSDDDFLERELTDDFLTAKYSPIQSATTTSLSGCSKGLQKQCSNFSHEGGPQKRSSNGNEIYLARPSISQDEIKPTRGFQPKTKMSTSPNGAENFKTEISCAQQVQSINDPSKPSLRRDQCRDNGATNKSPYTIVPATTRNTLPLPTATNTVESRNSAFLAEWNDNSFFNLPSKKALISSPSISNNEPEVVTRKLNRTVRIRRFPGPAGLLPPRHGNTSLVAPEEFLDELKSEHHEPDYKETEILSQSSGSVFEGGAWSAMLEDLGPTGLPLLNSMNLSSIKAIGRNVRSYKVPFLSVLVQSIDGALPDASVIFKDPTGDMHGVIHRDVWDQFSTDISVGTVLVLRNVGIMSAGTSSRKQVVNITGNNLTAIYSPKDELNIQLKRIHDFAAKNSNTLLAEWEKFESQTTNPPSPVSHRGIPMQSWRVPNMKPQLVQETFSPKRTDATKARSTSLQPPAARRFPPNMSSNPRPKVPSSSSPFMPMQNRDVSGPKGQNSVMSRDANVGFAANHKPVNKTSFTLKAPTSHNLPQTTLHDRFRFSPLKCPESEPTCSSHLSGNASTNRQPSFLSPQNPKVSQSTVSSLPTNQNKSNSRSHFQIDADTSTIDSLLEGIDADSLFGDF